jgi:ubiquinone/menaquinone biosynthesis C-methylase UbiE
MRLTRETAIRINRFFDRWLPPAVRDCRWLWVIPFRLFYGPSYRIFLDFKTSDTWKNQAALDRFYADTQTAPPQRATHLNRACFEAIAGLFSGSDVLEVGAGNCLLAKKLAALGNRVTACDVALPETERDSAITYVPGDAVRLPFPDRSFDDAVCTHTLEHVPDVRRAVEELRRVARRRIIIVVPRQHAALRTFDPHLHFFPYEFSVRLVFGPPRGLASCELTGGDWLYVEEVTG